MAADPLAALMELTGVAASLQQARDAVDGALRHRVLRRNSAPVTSESLLRGARASAALEGHGVDLEALRGAAVADPVASGAVRVASGLGALAEVWGRSPKQALARLHVLAAAGTMPNEDLGRPDLPPELAPRLDLLCDLVAGSAYRTAASRVPAVLLAAVVGGELLALRPFGSHTGIIARAASRLTLIQRGLDPKSVIPVEIGHLAREPEYRGCAGSFATGSADGVRAWLRHYCAAVEAGSVAARAICDEVAGGGPVIAQDGPVA